MPAPPENGNRQSESDITSIDYVHTCEFSSQATLFLYPLVPLLVTVVARSHHRLYDLHAAPAILDGG